MTEQFNEHDDAGVGDAALVDLVGSAFDEGRRGRDAQQVLARGRALRRRRRAVPALSALGVLAASASLAVALTGPSGAAGSTNAGAGHSLTANGTAVNVDNAAFSVRTDTKTGKVTVTLKQSVDESALKQILAEAGIRTYFSSTTVTQHPGQAVPISVCKYVGATPVGSADLTASVVYPTSKSPDTTITIDPSKMPSGSVLAFNFEYIANDKGADVVSMALLSGEPTACIATQTAAGAKE
jgi:hypothetical protein